MSSFFIKLSTFLFSYILMLDYSTEITFPIKLYGKLILNTLIANSV